MLERATPLARAALLALALPSTACVAAKPPASAPPSHPEAKAPPESGSARRAVPAEAARTPEPAPTLGPPPLDASWGTADPFTLVAASAERRWVALCQARADTDGNGRIEVRVGPTGELGGDRLDGYFVDAPGPGIPIEAFAGTDPSGRFAAFVRGGRLTLRDVARGVDAELDADLRDDTNPFLHARYVAFDPTGRRMLYLARAEGRAAVVVRALDDGTEVRIEPGDGELYRADFDTTGEVVVFRMMTTDTNGNGRLDWPAPTTAPWMRCIGPIPRFPVFERPRDEPLSRLSRVDGAGITDAVGLVVPFGDGFVARAPDGSLELRGKDAPRTLVPKTCEPRVVHADLRRKFLVVTCQKKKKGSRPELLLVTPSSTKPLGLAMSGAAGDHWLEGSPRLVPLYPGSDTVLLDADTGLVEALAPGDRVLGSSGTRALVLRGKELQFREPGAAPVRLPGITAPLFRVARTGNVVAVPPFVVDVDTGRALGTTRARPLAVSRDGAVLVAAGRPPDAEGLAVGPLRWEMPEPLGAPPLGAPGAGR